MSQTSTTEFRKAVTDDFLKTVSAFENSGVGESSLGWRTAARLKVWRMLDRIA